MTLPGGYINRYECWRFHPIAIAILKEMGSEWCALNCSLRVERIPTSFGSYNPSRYIEYGPEGEYISDIPAFMR